MTAAEAILVRTPDGRDLEVLTGGDEEGFPLLFHSGSPSAAVHDADIEAAAAEQGLRLVTYSRPGYGASTPRKRSGVVADDVQDSAVVLGSLEITDFLTLGWSSGGPRALACAALLPARCRAAATLAGVAPFQADRLDWSAGMGPENVEEYAAAVRGAEVYEELLQRVLQPVFAATPDQVVEAFGGLLTPVDAKYLTGEVADTMSRTLHRAGAQGVVGARDDGLALVAPWGFDVSGIAVPVAVWQGGQDAMVPYAHGEWLAANIPGARAHLHEEEGHLSLAARMPRILADLRDLGGLGPRPEVRAREAVRGTG